MLAADVGAGVVDQDVDRSARRGHLGGEPRHVGRRR